MSKCDSLTTARFQSATDIVLYSSISIGLAALLTLKSVPGILPAAFVFGWAQAGGL